MLVLAVGLLQASRGVHGSTYTKALASLKAHTSQQLAEMEEAASALSQSKGQHRFALPLASTALDSVWIMQYAAGHMPNASTAAGA